MSSPMSKYISAPYEYNGRCLKNGIDCYGLVVLYYKNELGIEVSDDYNSGSSYDDVKDTNVFLDNADIEFIKVPLEQIQLHDVILIRNGKSLVPNHSGIYRGGGKFIHTIESLGCNVSRLDTWRAKIWGVYRHKELFQKG